MGFATTFSFCYSCSEVHVAANEVLNSGLAVKLRDRKGYELTQWCVIALSNELFLAWSESPELCIQLIIGFWSQSKY
jgi:hypothetical protein